MVSPLVMTVGSIWLTPQAATRAAEDEQAAQQKTAVHHGAASQNGVVPIATTGHESHEDDTATAEIETPVEHRDRSRVRESHRFGCSINLYRHVDSQASR